MKEPLAVQPGDVLLAGGTSPLARRIMRLTRGPVYHAAFVLDDTTILEATTDTLAPRQTSAIPAPKALEAWSRVVIEHGIVTVHVLRYKGFLDGLDRQPVLRRARMISGEGHTYAADRLILMALHCLTSRLGIDEWPSTEKYFEEALTALDDHVGESPAMVCSELAARVFLEAAPDCTYRISLANTDTGNPSVSARPADDVAATPSTAALAEFLIARAEPGSMLSVQAEPGSTRSADVETRGPLGGRAGTGGMDGGQDAYGPQAQHHRCQDPAIGGPGRQRSRSSSGCAALRPPVHGRLPRPFHRGHPAERDHQPVRHPGAPEPVAVRIGTRVHHPRRSVLLTVFRSRRVRRAERPDC